MQGSALASFKCHAAICKWHARWRAIHSGPGDIYT